MSEHEYKQDCVVNLACRSLRMVGQLKNASGSHAQPKLEWVRPKTRKLEMHAHLIARILQGRSISRRERSLLQRVITDLFRLIPFSFFIIIPAMEIFLPVAIWLFPNMVPSQFADEKQRSERKTPSDAWNQ